MAYVTFSTIMTLIGFQCPYIVIQFGWLVSWTYLRFYKKSSADIAGGGILYGDRSETFAFVNWFPPLIQYVPFIVSFSCCLRNPGQLSRIIAFKLHTFLRDTVAHYSFH
jgi:hypothetical protein